MSTTPSLNPTAHSFPFPQSSPTISTVSAETASTWTSFSATSGLSTTSDPPSSHESTKFNSSEKRVNQFGDGWISATNHYVLTDDHLDVSFIPRRSRSPSLPILPSQTNTPRAFRTEDDEIVDSFSRLDVDIQPLPLGRGYQARPYPSTGLFGGNIACANATAAADQYEVQKPSHHLYHHASVPNLTSAPRRRVSGQVRFPDEIDEDEVFQPPTLGVDARRLGSKSMSVLTGPLRGKNVYIASVQPSTTVEDLEREARQFGEVLMARIQKVGCEGQNVDLLWQSATQRHCAFVLYETPDQATAFLEHLKARGVMCDYAKEDFQTEWKSREDRQSSNLYIQGLPLDLDIKNGALDALLAPFGTVSSYKCLTDENGFRRGPVLARMEHRSQAESAIKGLNNKSYCPNGPLLQVRIADSESQKDFKRKANTFGDLESAGYLRDDSRRTSMPAIPSMTAAEAAALERRRELAYQEIVALDARLHQIKSDTFPRRSINRPSIFATQVSRHDQNSTRFEYERQHSTSDASPTPSLSYTDRTLSFASVTSGYSESSTPSSIWSPGGFGTTAKRFGAFDRIAPAGHGLHHARSSPELGTGLDNPAKLLWPEQSSQMNRL